MTVIKTHPILHQDNTKIKNTVKATSITESRVIGSSTTEKNTNVAVSVLHGTLLNDALEGSKKSSYSASVSSADTIPPTDIMKRKERRERKGKGEGEGGIVVTNFSSDTVFDQKRVGDQSKRVRLGEKKEKEEGEEIVVGQHVSNTLDIAPLHKDLSTAPSSFLAATAHTTRHEGAMQKLNSTTAIVKRILNFNLKLNFNFNFNRWSAQPRVHLQHEIQGPIRITGNQSPEILGSIATRWDGVLEGRVHRPRGAPLHLPQV